MQFNRPTGVACLGGDIFVVDSYSDRIQRLDGDTGAFKAAIGSQGSGPGRFNRPVQIASSPDGSLFVTGGPGAGWHAATHAPLWPA